MGDLWHTQSQKICISGKDDGLELGVASVTIASDLSQHHVLVTSSCAHVHVRACVHVGVQYGCSAMFFSSTCLLVVTRARADVDVIGDLKGRTADPFVPRVGAGQPRRHKSRGGGGPACRVALREARGVEEGGGQECEGDEAELRLDGQELFGRLSTC